MATAKKLKSGNWRVRVFSHMDGEKPVYRSFTAATKAEAQRMASEFQCGRDIPEDKTVLQCVDEYIASKTGVLSPSSVRGYESIKKRLCPLYDKKISKLRSADLQYFVSQLSTEVSPKTVRNVYSLLMSSISAVDDRRFKVTLPAKRPPEYNTPTDADVKKLLQAASPSLRIAILLASVGTLRRGEICALDYADVLHDFNAVFVHRSAVIDIDGHVIIRDIPKTSGSIRRITLPKEVMHEIGHGNGLVYPKSPSALESDFRRLRDKLGLKCRFHDLRHYAASIMHAIGVPDQYIMERGGWSDDRVLKSVYRNTLSDKQKEFTKKTNSYFSDTLLRAN